MPLSFEVDPVSLILNLEMTGEFSAAEIEAIQATVQEHAKTTTLKGVLLDVRGATVPGVSSESIQMAARRAQTFEATQGLRMAVIADTDLAFGLSRMYELVRNEDGSIRVFRERELAVEWLEAVDPAN